MLWLLGMLWLAVDPESVAVLLIAAGVVVMTHSQAWPFGYTPAAGPSVKLWSPLEGSSHAVPWHTPAALLEEEVE